MELKHENRSYLLERNIEKSKPKVMDRRDMLRRLNGIIIENTPAISYVVAGVMVLLYLPAWSMIPIMIISSAMVDEVLPKTPSDDYIGIYILRNGLMALIASLFGFQSALFYLIQYGLISFFSPLVSKISDVCESTCMRLYGVK